MLFDKAAPKSTAASSTLMMIPLNIQKTVEFSITTPELFPTSFIDSFMNRFFFPDTWVTNWENRTEIMLKFSHKGSFVRVTGACAQRGFSISPAAAPQRCSVSGWNLIRGLMWPFHGVKVFLCTLLCAPSTACTCEPILNTKLNLAAFKPWMIHANDCISKWFVFKWHLNLNVYFLMSHMTSHFLRPRQTEVGLLLHRHLLPQQHLRVRVLLLPSRVTLHSLSILPAKDQGNKVVFFFFGSLFKNKSKLWLFPLCHTATSKPFSSFRERIELETGCHSYRQIPIITLFMYNTLSGGTLQRLKKKEPPLPLFCCKCL